MKFIGNTPDYETYFVEVDEKFFKRRGVEPIYAAKQRLKEKGVDPETVRPADEA